MILDKFSLQGKKGIVTGGGSGIGRAWPRDWPRLGRMC